MRTMRTPMVRFGVSLAIGSLLWAAVPAHAQESPAARVDPGEIERRIQQIRPRPPVERPPEVAPLGPAPEVEAEPEVSFVLTAVAIEGATVFSAADLGPLYAEFLARTVGRSEFEEIAARVTRAYTEAGYFISRAIVPPQSIEGGILRVRVIEGFLAGVRFDGGEDQAGLLDGYADSITGERPARLSTVERGLLLINGLPGIEVTDIQVARLDDDGAYELAVEVGYDMAEGAVNLDNRGTPEVGRLQAWLSGALNSAAGLGEQLQIALATVPDDPRELIYGQVAYEQPLGHAGTILGASVGASTIDAGADLAREDTMARSLSIRANVRHPLVLSRRRTVYLRGALEYVDVKEDRFDQSTIDDRLRVLRLQADYTVQDDWRGTSFFALEASQGFDVLNASDGDDLTLSRFDGEGTFTKFKLDAIRVQEIWGPVSLRLAAQAQAALDPLLSSEEFLLGGSQFGRAYDFGELSGEDGIAGSMELRYGREREATVLTGYEVYGFYDVGAVWNRNTEGDQRRDSLASAGGGLRLALLRDVQATIEVAKPLTRAVASTGDNDTRVFFSISAQF